MPTTYPLYHMIANSVQARLNCIERKNTEWLHKHTDHLRQLTNLLPSGSGINIGTSIDLDKSTGDKLVLHTAFHQMNENGYYAGWTEHTITVRPALLGQITLSISGRNRNEVKDYLHDVYEHALKRHVIAEYNQEQDETTYRFTE